MNTAQQQVQALAGVMQAVCQIEDIANRGETDPSATRTSLTSILQQSADDLEQAVGSVTNLRYGLQRMQGMLQGEQKYLPALQYAMAVMQMAKNMRRSDRVQQAVARELELISMSIDQEGADKQDTAAVDHLSSADPADGDSGDDTGDDYAHPAPELVAQLADVWTSEVRKLEPQVVVHGKPVYLQNDNNIQMIRALLLAALRCSWLWQQLGGRRWHLLLRRKRLLFNIRELLD